MNEREIKKPIVAITMGDPAGIGPELVIKVLSRQSHSESCRPLFIGDLQVMQKAAELVGSNLRFRAVSSLDSAEFSWPVIDLLCPVDLRVESILLGKVDPRMGYAAASCLRTATELALEGKIQGIVSSPLNKEAFHMAGFHYPDELAYMAELTHSSSTTIVGLMKHIWTIAVTEHIPLKDVPAQIKKDKIMHAVQIIHQLLVDQGNSSLRIAVAALNPHAGDGGFMGREEIDEIQPAIDEASAAGMNVSGPIPADMVFTLALQGSFDGVVCMYHDQANIARKLQPKEESATLFIGLPFACGTTAHGTAFDIAGQGIADPGSLDLALQCVVKLTQGNIKPLLRK